MKRLTIFIITMLLLCINLSASAATISINRNATYDPDVIDTDNTRLSVYKIFDVEKTPDGNGVTYYMTEDNPWYNIVSNIGYFTLNALYDNSKTFVTLNNTVMSDTEIAEDFSNILKRNLNNLILSGQYEERQLHYNESLSVEDGYYLVVSNLGSNVILATSDINITEKNDYPSVNKTIAEEDQHAQIGDEIHFQLIVNVPNGANQPIILTDTMSYGLTFGYIASITDDIEYRLSEVDTIHNSFTISFHEDVVSAYQGRQIVIDYVARLNGMAIYYISETNEVKLRYDNVYTTLPVEVTVDTDEFRLLKYDGSDQEKKPLAGAEFQILRDGIPVQLINVNETTYRVTSETDSPTTNVFTTVADDLTTIYGLDRDITYQLMEVTPPNGYNLSSEIYDIQIPSDYELIVEFPNNKGRELPSTGGSGTTTYFFVGGTIAVIAGTLLTARVKNRDDDGEQ